MVATSFNLRDYKTLFGNYNRNPLLPRRFDLSLLLPYTPDTFRSVTWQKRPGTNESNCNVIPSYVSEIPYFSPHNNNHHHHHHNLSRPSLQLLIFAPLISQRNEMAQPDMGLLSASLETVGREIGRLPNLPVIDQGAQIVRQLQQLRQENRNYQLQLQQQMNAGFDRLNVRMDSMYVY